MTKFGRAVRRTAVMLACATLAAFSSISAGQAQEFPTRPIKMIVLLSPGGVTDAAARFLAEHLTQELGQPVTVENRPGGGGLIGVSALAQAKPDGYTICFCSSAPVTLLPLQRDDISYDPTKLKLIKHLYNVDLFLVARKDLGVDTLEEFVELAKSKPGALRYGSTGAGGITHLAMELLKEEAGVNLIHVPYEGGAPMMLDILGGRIEFGVVSALEANKYREEGKINVLGSTGEDRLELLGDVPLIAEKYPGYLANSWGALIAPPGTPDEVAKRINEAATAALAKPEVIERLKTIGLTPVANEPVSELEAKLDAERERWRALLKTIGDVQQ